MSDDLSWVREENAPWLCTFSLISAVLLRFAILEETLACDLPDEAKGIIIDAIKISLVNLMFRV